MAAISLSIQVVSHSTYTLDVNPDWTIDQVRTRLAAQYPEFAVLSTADTLVFAADQSLGSQTLRELGIESGSAIFFVLPRPANTLSLTRIGDRSPCASITPSQSPALAGRNDVSFAQPLALDLEPLIEEIGGEVDGVSHGQARFLFNDGQWLIQPYERARTPVFVNDRQVSPIEIVTLQESDVVAFGSSHGRPVIQFTVHFVLSQEQR